MLKRFPWYFLIAPAGFTPLLVYVAIKAFQESPIISMVSVILLLVFWFAMIFLGIWCAVSDLESDHRSKVWWYQRENNILKVKSERYHDDICEARKNIKRVTEDLNLYMETCPDQCVVNTVKTHCIRVDRVMEDLETRTNGK